MAAFHELIKNYEKIRAYLRDFLIYGYKTRNDYEQKSGRSYDNERRRIENYLSNYMKQENSVKGKRVFISANTVEMEENPLFVTWQTKSFTKNDILLHFLILDLLSHHEALTLQEISDRLTLDYFNNIKTPLPDPMTIRNKLNEYVALSYIQAEKRGRSLKYTLSQNLLTLIGEDTQACLSDACRFFQNTTPMGVLGYFINQKLNPRKESYFGFRHLYLAWTLDSEVIHSLLKAIQQESMVSIESISIKKNVQVRLTIIPLKILARLSTGRHYLAAFQPKTGKYCSFRLDRIQKVTLEDTASQFLTHQKIVSEILQKSWGIALSSRHKMEHLRLHLYIDEDTEDYVVKRIVREGRHGVLEKTQPNHFLYTIDVVDTMEMLPWLRTFIGRITQLEISNQAVEDIFWKDVQEMILMYQS